MIQLPETAVLEITARCNHRCFFCSCPWEKNSFVIKEELDIRTWCKILDFLQRNGVKHVTFTGGEVTMRKDLFDLLDYAFEKKISFGVISNGLCIDDIFLVIITVILILVTKTGWTLREGTVIAALIFGPAMDFFKEKIWKGNGVKKSS